MGRQFFGAVYLFARKGVQAIFFSRYFFFIFFLLMLCTILFFKVKPVLDLFFEESCIYIDIDFFIFKRFLPTSFY